MFAAAPPVPSMIAISAALCVGLLLIVVGAVLLAIDLGDPLQRKASAAVACASLALGLVLIIVGADPLCRWLVMIV